MKVYNVELLILLFAFSSAS